MERLRATPESYARKIEFLMAAKAEKAHKRFPNVRTLTEDGWVKVKNIGAVYNGSSSATLQSIADQYQITKEQVRVYCKEFIKYLWGNCSKETQGKYPLETIPFDKPITQTSAEKRSQVQGGRTLKVREEVERGVADWDQIAENLGLSVEDVRQSWKILRRWGVALPFERRQQSYQEFKDKIEKETDDKKLQALLNEPSDGSLHGFILNKDRQSTVALLGSTLHELGFNFMDARFVAEIFKQIGVPIRIIGTYQTVRKKEYMSSYYIFLAKHKQRAIDVIRALEAAGNKRLRKVGMKQSAEN